ncbi:MAG TPA: hypothetical protein VKE96_00450 [Vicinamibacterales bacterium]|nr:hypothetical protein [Vicinamibacterales bacterium]
MSDERHSTHIVALTAAQLDVRRSQATAVLAASVQAAQAKTFRQLLWRRLTLAAVIWSLLGFLHVVPMIGIVVGWSLFVVTAVGAGVFEHRAGRRVVDLLAASTENRGS